MAKRIPSPRIRDQVCSQDYQAKRTATKPDAKVIYGDRHPIRSTRNINYIYGEPPRPEPPTPPRLFVRGCIGGSFKIDLLGLGVRLSPSAFSQWISDESLASIHVHQGDLAIVDPMRNLKHRDIVMVLQDGHEVFRQLLKSRGIWWLKNLDGADSTAVPLLVLPLYGVVLGFLRLCVTSKAVNYALGEKNFVSPERKGLGPRYKKEEASSGLNGQKRPYTRRESAALILASEQAGPRYSSSKIRKKRS